MLTVSLKYTKDNEIDAEDFEEQDYDEIIEEAIERQYRDENTDINLYEMLEKEIK